MSPENVEGASCSHFRAQARKWTQRAPEMPPGAISEPRSEMAPESSREASWNYFRAQVRKWSKRNPDRPPGIMSEPRPKNGPRELQRRFLEACPSPSQKMGPENFREASWNHFRAQARKSLQR
eukprot:12401673-Karenia_brevis.AAC.1